ncbi:MAG TPA: ATP-binding protein [Acidimicrobiales bacterium]|nr:ATP-binding protein [Acidimicrobiales bacterium]
MAPPPPPPWTDLADVLLRREALRARIGRGAPPDPFAGLRIAEADLDRMIAELPGFVPPDPAAWAEIDAAVGGEIDEVRARFHDALGADTPLGRIAAHAALGPAEAEVLALAAAVELDPARQRLLGYVHDDVTSVRPTVHTLNQVFGADHPGVATLAPDGRLRRAALVAVDQPGAWSSATVAVAPTVLWALVGDTSTDPALPAGHEIIERAGAPGAHRLTVVAGPDRTRRLQAALAGTAATSFLVVDLPPDADTWDAVVRQATVAGLGVILELGDTLPAEARRRVERADHLAWALSSRLDLPIDELPRQPWTELHPDAPEARPEEWREVLGTDDRAGHRLTADQLRLVGDARAAIGPGTDLDAAVRRLAAGRIDRLARRIRPRRTWDDLVVTPDRLAQLRELASRYRQRDVVYGDWGFRAVPSAGLVALFSGPSGTGKTLTAEIIAGELGLDLYKLELSSVVSKYIGETEKHLEQLFDAAAAGNVVLFFDEADALFGKRSEVSDAHDRYANIETSYLLQRLESYDGFVVLATNFQKNIDNAFLRRIHVALEFPVPDERERRAIWAQSFPAAAPVADVDLDFLASHFELSGGSIRNAALNTAFLAAEAGTPITMETVMFGMKREYQKLGRLRTADDFGPYHALVNGPDAER